jgi:hypothetical protein
MFGDVACNEKKLNLFIFVFFVFLVGGPASDLAERHEAACAQQAAKIFFK